MVKAYSYWCVNLHTIIVKAYRQLWYILTQNIWYVSQYYGVNFHKSCIILNRLYQLYTTVRLEAAILSPVLWSKVTPNVLQCNFTQKMRYSDNTLICRKCIEVLLKRWFWIFFLVFFSVNLCAKYLNNFFIICYLIFVCILN